MMASDGHVSMHDALTLKETTNKRKPHVMPITSLVFKEEEQLIITAGLDYKYCILPQNASSMLSYVGALMVNMGILLLILLYFAEWLA